MADQLVTWTPPGPVGKAFMESNAFIRSIMGPIGSGKSVCCVVELLRRAQMQAKGPDGKRHTRFAIVRNSYPQLKTTTVKTWLDWCPASFGKLTMASPINHHVTTDDIDMEVIFLALDVDADVRKLMSLELTSIFLNECRYIPKGVLDGATGRVGRYPSVRDGGCTWAGVIMDTNPPDTEHWLYRLAEGVDIEMVEQTRALEHKMRLDGLIGENQPLMEFFKQPSGLSPEAENLQNLRKGYYHFASVGKSDDWIKVYVEGSYGFVVEGQPVYPGYRDSIHTSKTPLSPIAGLPILVGADFGLTPAAVFAQRLPNGAWRILAELVTDDCGITRFGELLVAFKAQHFPGHNIGGAWGDPAGASRGQDAEAVIDILNLNTGWKFRPAPTNSIDLRLEAVTLPLDRMIDGAPGFLISPTCATLRKGFAGSYHYKLVASANGATVHETPAKNKYSHIHDALQYLVLGGGEYELVQGKALKKPRLRTAVAEGVNQEPFSPEPRQQNPQYTNEKMMREWRDGPPRRQAIAFGTDDAV